MQLQAIMHTYRLYRRLINAVLVSFVVAIVLTISLIVAPLARAIDIGGPSDCDNNAIISCGVHSTGAVIDAYNSSAYVRAVYAYFGINRADIANLPASNMAGRVTKDGNVFVDGQSQAVATDAITGGRHNIPGSVQVNSNGAIFFKRPPSVSFLQDSLPAFVAMQNGRFQFAIIASCGNAVIATPTAAPKMAVAPARVVSQPKPAPVPPAPAATPSQTQSQAQSQQVNVNNTNANTQINNNQPATPETSAAPAGTVAATQPAAQQISSLPNTGPTDVIGVFLVSVGAGALAYRYLLVRRLSP